MLCRGAPQKRESSYCQKRGSGIVGDAEPCRLSDILELHIIADTVLPNGSVL